MGLNAPTNDLTGNTIAATYDQILFLDHADGIAESTLRQVAAQLSLSALWIAEEKVLIQSEDTDQAELFNVETIGSKSIILSGTAGVVINEDSESALDFRVESDGEDEALFMDASANTLYINKGETAFTTSIHSTNDVAITVGSAGVVFNEDEHATNDFRIAGANQTNLLFCDAGNDRVGLLTSTPDTLFHLGHNTNRNMRFFSGDSGILSETSPSSGVVTNQTVFSVTVPYNAADNGQGLLLDFVVIFTCRQSADHVSTKTHHIKCVVVRPGNNGGSAATTTTASLEGDATDAEGTALREVGTAATITATSFDTNAVIAATTGTHTLNIRATTEHDGGAVISAQYVGWAMGADSMEVTSS